MTWRLGQNLLVVNLWNNDGTRNLSEEHLRGLYDRMVRERTLKAVFFDGKVRSAENFLAFAASGEIRFYAGYTREEEALEPAGFFWLSDFKGLTAYIHFCLFRRLWGRASVGLAREILKGLLAAENENKDRYFRCVRAAVPRTNRLALGFIERIGFVILGTVPHGAWLAEEGRSVGLVEAYIT
ncbi:MAG: hypothetical protein AB1896_05460 [Thermodesulfobacteriota bacterium]